MLVLLDTIYKIGNGLAQEDMRDFPFTDVGSPTHPGLVHHGAIGWVMREVAWIGGHALVAQQVSQGLGAKEPMDEWMEFYEVIANPLPSI